LYNDTIKMIKQLKKEGCSLIICLSHLGYEYPDTKVSDLVLATTVQGIDLIIGGHTHTFLDKPKSIPHPDGDHITLVNQVGWAGINLGRIEYTFKGAKPLSMPQTSIIEINEKIPLRG
jgi:5'-nucleotidase